jgi:hypothetical protein
MRKEKEMKDKKQKTDRDKCRARTDRQTDRQIDQQADGQTDRGDKSGRGVQQWDLPGVWRLRQARKLRNVLNPERER